MGGRILDRSDDDIADMEKRLPAMTFETKERYFAVLSALVDKLETDGKGLRDVLQEMMAETAAYIFKEIGATS